MQGRHRRGHLDGREEPPPTGREHGQHPVLTGDGQDVTEGEEAGERKELERDVHTENVGGLTAV